MRNVIRYSIAIYIWIMLHQVLPSEAYAQSDLLRAQWRFSVMVSDLIRFAYRNGYRISFGDTYANSGHIKGSLHYTRLAIDINLFKNGKLLKDSTDHGVLGEYWESLGGQWGGLFGDGNHYEYRYEREH